MKTDPDIQYMLKLKDGDLEAFRILFEKYKIKILNFCFRFCADRRLAEELTQEVFLRVYSSASRYRPKAKFSTWIFKIATNLCLNEIRRKKKERSTETLDNKMNNNNQVFTQEIADKTQSDPQEMIESKQRDLMILEAFSTLPEQQRMALLLRAFNDFSYREIGMQIKASEKSVKSIIHRGRQKLKEILGDKLRGA